MTTAPLVSLPDEYLVDHRRIDKQHAEIFTRLAALSDEYENSGKVGKTGVKRLLQQIGKHFATEEEIAEKAGLLFAEHSKVHNDNLQQMKDSFDLVTDGLADTTAFLRYVDFWFMRHILQFDKPFVAELKATNAMQARK